MKLLILAPLLILASCHRPNAANCTTNKVGTVSTITCSDGTSSSVVDGAVGPQGVAPTPTPQDAVTADIASILADENTYRLSQGQTELSPGLSCTVQALSSGQWLSSGSPGFVAAQGVVVATGTAYSYLYEGDFNQPNASSGVNALIPLAIQPLFVGNNYRISCSGQLVVTATDYYTFNVNSDDGTILTIDGTQVVNNDGNHSIVDKAGVKLLRRDVHTFSLLYAQSGSGSFALVLTANGAAIDSRLYAH